MVGPQVVCLAGAARLKENPINSFASPIREVNGLLSGTTTLLGHFRFEFRLLNRQ